MRITVNPSDSYSRVAPFTRQSRRLATCRPQSYRNSSSTGPCIVRYVRQSCLLTNPRPLALPNASKAGNDIEVCGVDESSQPGSSSQTVLEAFYYGRAFAQLLSERVSSVVVDLLSEIGRNDAERRQAFRYAPCQLLQNMHLNASKPHRKNYLHYLLRMHESGAAEDVPGRMFRMAKLHAWLNSMPEGYLFWFSRQKYTYSANYTLFHSLLDHCVSLMHCNCTGLMSRRASK